MKEVSKHKPADFHGRFYKKKRLSNLVLLDNLFKSMKLKLVLSRFKMKL